jgi:hypothetical protein
VSSAADEPELTPEQEQIAKDFAAQLEDTEGVAVEADEDGKYWLTLGELSVELTDEQAAELNAALFASALARAKALAPKEVPDPWRQWHVRAAGYTFWLALSGITLAGAYAIIRSIIT